MSEAGGPVLRIERLTKAFRSPDGVTVPIVDIPAFALDAGDHVALRGPSGSGKTTLLHLVAGILEADGGRIGVDGTDITRLTESARDRWRASTLGYVFQTFNLLQGYTALENVLLGMAFGAGADVRHATELLERVGLAGRLHYRPAQLSVGQQHRVAVARALANRPRLVLADEPTGNLDPVHGAEALTLIREVCREHHAALLLVSHDPGVLGAFERVEDLTALNRAAVAAACTSAEAPAPR